MIASLRVLSGAAWNAHQAGVVFLWSMTWLRSNLEFDAPETVWGRAGIRGVHLGNFRL
jgi:hypothetical protein